MLLFQLTFGVVLIMNQCQEPHVSYIELLCVQKGFYLKSGTSGNQMEKWEEDRDRIAARYFLPGGCPHTHTQFWHCSDGQAAAKPETLPMNHLSHIHLTVTVSTRLYSWSVAQQISRKCSASIKALHLLWRLVWLLHNTACCKAKGQVSVSVQRRGFM